MKCPGCGAELDSGAYFCSECGHVMSRNTVNDSIAPPDYIAQTEPNKDMTRILPAWREQMVCPDCGFECSNGSPFCPQCGHRLEQRNIPAAPPKKNTAYIVIIIIMSAIIIGIISFIVTYIVYNNTNKKEDASPTAAPLNVTAAPATAEPLPTEEPAAVNKYSFESNVYRVPVYSKSSTYRRMPDIHKTDESSDARLNELADVIFDFDRCCEAYMNYGSSEIFKYIKRGSTAYDQQTGYKSKNPGLTQKYLRVEVIDAREYNGYYYVWASEQLEVTENGSVSNTSDRWVYKLSYGSDGWVINDYTRDPVFN